MNTTIVVPTIREHSIREFLMAWREEFEGHRVIVVEDNPERTFALPDWVTHVSWKEIDADLKENAWIIPRRTGAIRNYGMLLAAATKADMIVLLDDDCLPYADEFLAHHSVALGSPGTTQPMFDTMFELGWNRPKARGYPKESAFATTVLNHGLWNGVPDLDGETQLRHEDLRVEFPWHSIQIPHGILFPMCAMNVAFRPELLPAMYQLPMGQGQPFHRFDDIWCGWIMKKACDHLGWSVRSGAPFVNHNRASDAKRNAELEAPGIVENERVWRTVDQVRLGVAQSLDSCLLRIYDHLTGTEYWERASKAAYIWRRLVAERSKQHVVETYESPFPACQKCHKGYDEKGRCGCPNP